MMNHNGQNRSKKKPKKNSQVRTLNSLSYLLPDDDHKVYFQKQNFLEKFFRNFLIIREFHNGKKPMFWIEGWKIFVVVVSSENKTEKLDNITNKDRVEMKRS